MRFPSSYSDFSICPVASAMTMQNLKIEDKQPR